MSDEEQDVEMEELPDFEEADVDLEKPVERRPAASDLPAKVKVAGKNWSDLSEHWNAEESGKVRNTAFGVTGPHTPVRDSRRFINYGTDSLENKKLQIESRLDFKHRKDPLEMKKFHSSGNGEDNDAGDEDEGEIFTSESDSDEEANVDPWSQRLVGCRMKMYADEEEENRKRDNEIKKRYAQKDSTLGAHTGLRISIENSGDGDKSGGEGDSDDWPRRSHREGDSRRSSRGENDGFHNYLSRDVEDRHNRRVPRNRDEDHYRNRDRSREGHQNPYYPGLGRVARPTISGHKHKLTVKERLGVGRSINTRRRSLDSDEKPSVKSRLGMRPRDT